MDVGLDTSCSIYLPSCSTSAQPPTKDTARPSTRREMLPITVHSPLSLHSSPCKQVLNVPSDKGQLVFKRSTVNTKDSLRSIKLGNTGEVLPLEDPSINIVLDKSKNKCENLQLSENKLKRKNESFSLCKIKRKISKLSSDNTASKVSPICLDLREPEEDTTVLSTTTKTLSKNKNVQTFTTNSCINYINRRTKAKDVPSKLDDLKSPKSKTKLVHSDYQYKKPTYCIKERRPRSAGSKRRKSFVKSKLSSFSKEKSTYSTRKKISKESSKETETITCTSASTSIDITNTSTTLPSNITMPSISQLETEICTCGSLSEKQLIPWNPENRMIARLSEIDRRVGHYVKNTVRIISRLDNRTINRQQQRVVTRIRIPGMPFGKWMGSNCNEQ
ncbi:hypothetical protein ILUMI_01290 [Ignelater luminosus]|uniref:Uncharacterized protein n=1 Tax=Ignelater luminosus TaxID=2038154 RepID=A0A8K0GPD3_IGNLU|nr:hypothetical protein ILUMI_01290 [Ignelater luminosus]